MALSAVHNLEIRTASTRGILSKHSFTDRWSGYPSYSHYTALIESILVLLRVLAVLAVPVLAVPAGRNTASTWQYPQYRSLKYMKYGSIRQAEYSTAVVDPEILRAWHYQQGTIPK